MSLRTAQVPKRDGIAIQYDPTQVPTSELNVIEALDKLAGTQVGVSILERIAASKPAFTPPKEAEPTFPRELGCKVLITPTWHRMRVPKGYRFVGGALFPAAPDHPASQVAGTHYLSTYSRTCAPPYNQGAAIGGGGSCCKVEFNSTTMTTDSGQKTYPFLVLGHELIHVVHALYGIMQPEKADEEKWTTGLGPFADEPLSENALRRELKAAGMEIDVRGSY